MLIAEVAGLLEETLGSEDVVVQAEGDPERNEAGFMHRFLVKPGDAVDTFPTGASSSASRPQVEVRQDTDGEANAETVKQLLGDPFEMAVRAMVSALENGSPEASRARAQGLLERAKLQFGVGLLPREALPGGIEQLESALLTFLPPDYVDDDEIYYFHNLPSADRDFIDYWWRLMFRYLRQDQYQQADLTIADTAIVSQEDYEAAQEEKMLMKDLEGAEKREAQAIAESEFAALQDSQASEYAAFADRLEQEKAARQYRDWEEWEMAAEMQRPPKRVRHGEIKVQLRGYVNETCAQSMQWTMRANQTLHLQLSIATPSCSALVPDTSTAQGSVVSRSCSALSSGGEQGRCGREEWQDGTSNARVRDVMAPAERESGVEQEDGGTGRTSGLAELPEGTVCGDGRESPNERELECEDRGLERQRDDEERAAAGCGQGSTTRFEVEMVEGLVARPEGGQREMDETGELYLPVNAGADAPTEISMAPALPPPSEGPRGFGHLVPSTDTVVLDDSQIASVDF